MKEFMLKSRSHCPFVAGLFIVFALLAAAIAPCACDSQAHVLSRNGFEDVEDDDDDDERDHEDEKQVIKPAASDERGTNAPDESGTALEALDAGPNDAG